MSLLTMSKSLQGEIPGVGLTLAKLKIQDALSKIYDESDWSFQSQQSGWLCPGLLANSGTFTVTPFSDQVIADATATAALAALVGRPLITELQYRDPARAIYNIVGYDLDTNAPFATLTLDRNWMEPTSGPGQPFMIYQAYFVAPVPDFRKFLEVRDTTNVKRLDYWSYSQADLAREDPQRTKFSMPNFVVPVGVDQRPGSATLGYQTFELWPQQLSRVPYSFSYNRRGPALVNPQDCVPYPLTEELVMLRAKEMLCLYKESNKGENVQRGSGANWAFLAQTFHAEYVECLDKIRAIDCNLVNYYVTRVDDRQATSGAAFSNRLGQLNIGGY